MDSSLLLLCEKWMSAVKGKNKKMIAGQRESDFENAAQWEYDKVMPL